MCSEVLGLLSSTETSPRCCTDASRAPGIKTLHHFPSASAQWLNERGKWCCALPARGNANSFVLYLSTYNNELGVALRCSRRAVPSPKNGSQFKMSYTKVICGVLGGVGMSSIRAGPYTASFTPNPVTALKGTAALHLTSLSSLVFRWEELIRLTDFVKYIVSSALLHNVTVICMSQQISIYSALDPSDETGYNLLVQSGQIWH